MEQQEEKSESGMSILRVGKSSLIPSEARAAETTDPIHLLVVLEEAIIFPFLVSSRRTNLRVISRSQKQSENGQGLYLPSQLNENERWL